jgi:hypothetical protein
LNTNKKKGEIKNKNVFVFNRFLSCKEAIDYKLKDILAPGEKEIK